MQGVLRFSLCVLPSLIVVLATLPGCNSEEERPKKKDWASGEEEKPLVELKVEEKNYGPVTGKVVLDVSFNPPKAEMLGMGDHRNQCHIDAPGNNLGIAIGPKDWEMDPKWIVSESRGVKNVVVFLQPPDGQFFFVPEDQRKPKNVSLEQPHCAFIPRVFTLFPSYHDGKTGSPVDTEQVLLIKSSSRVNHNYSIDGAGLRVNNALPAGAKEARITAKAEIPAQIMTISCNIHSWMRAYGFVLAHPFAAVTNDKGEFKIDKAPLGVKLQVVAWHEGGVNQGYFLKGASDGDTTTLVANQSLTLTLKGR